MFKQKKVYLLTIQIIWVNVLRFVNTSHSNKYLLLNYDKMLIKFLKINKYNICFIILL